MTQPITDDITRALELARRAHEARGVPEISEPVERHRQLYGVLDSLPLEARRASGADLEARIHPRVLRAVQAWRWGGGNLVLMGATGTGKTSAAVFLVRRLCSEGAIRGGEAFELARIIRWQSCRALSEVARETRLGTGVPEAVTRCQNARLLVLNDLGVDDDRKSLERVLDERYERGWPTVTTTGLGRLELEASFGDALTRRIFECKGDKGTFVEIVGNACR